MKKKSSNLKESSDFLDVLQKSHVGRFAVHMTKVKDQNLYILRGHLLIEEQLRELINLKTKKPDILTEARLTFNQILCIAQAFYWQRGSEWLWKGIRKLNGIRNSLSHKLTPEKYDKNIDDFLKIVEAKNPNKLGKGLATNFRLLLAMAFIYCHLSAYLEASTNSETGYC